MKRLALLLILISGLAGAQDSPSAPPVKATVYLYRLKMFYASMRKPSVFCDSKEVGRIENGRYFKLELEPGKHFFRANDGGKSGFEADLKPGQQYYVRVDMGPSGFKQHARVTFVAPEQGTEEIKMVFRQ